MSFLLSRRAALWRGTFLGLASAACLPASAQQLSPPPSPGLEVPFAPALQDDAPTPLPPECAPALQPRLSQPGGQNRVSPQAATRLTPISAPPDGFYQTPAQLDPWLLNLAKARPAQVKTRILTTTPGGRRVVSLEITPPGVSPWKLRRLVVLCRQHGNEPEASASGARFIREFLTTTDPKKRRITARTALLIVPIANPDGAAAYRRRTDNNVDMNRDWGKYKSVEVRALENWIGAWKPHLVVDVHQWLPFERMPPPMAEASGGALAKKTVHAMANNSASRGYWLAARSRWGLDTLCHRFWGQRFKTPSILLETRHRPTVAGARDVAIGTSLTALWSAAESITR